MTPTYPTPVPARPLCAAAARARDDSLVGTVPVTRRWLLIEHPGPWQHDALGGLGLPGDVLEPLVAAIRSAGARALLIRRPGRQQAGADRAWGVLDQRAGWASWGRWAEPADLLRAAEVLTADPLTADPLAADPPSADSPTGAAEQTLLVCTHGRHDTCCAVWGRPVAAALAEVWPDQTWECSHLGGDRFAANVLLAPDGYYYGMLDASNAVGVVAAHLRGEVDPEFLRGSTDVPPVVQAAIAAARRRFAPAPARAVRAEELHALDVDRWAVTLTADGPFPARIHVVVTRSRQEPALLTCGAVQASSAAVFTASEITEVDAAGLPHH